MYILTVSMCTEGKFVADAASLQIQNGFKSLQEDNFPNCFKVMEQLSLEELKSVFFLLMDFIGTDTYFSIMPLSKDELYANLRFILQQNSKTSCFGEQLIIEVLGTMKKFKLLRLLGVCKHEVVQMEKKQSHIRPFWKLLYNICDNLDDEEVQKLKLLFSLSTPLTYAEDLFCYLCHSNLIHEKNFSKLIQVLTNIERLDLVQEITLYIETSAKKDIQSYDIRDPMQNNPCGLAVIVNLDKFQENPILDSRSGQLPFLEDRDGSHIDKEKLSKLWTDFGFKTEVHDNLSAADILRLFSNLQNRRNQDFDIFVACLLSHGDKDIIYGHDCRPVKIDSIISAVDKCSFLNGKPKLFFIQACQGRRHQEGVRFNSNNSGLVMDAIPNHSEMMEYNHHVELSDMYKAVAVIEGYVSYRSPSSGSLFITELVENLEISGDKKDLELIMQDVKAATAAPPVKQMPITSGTLRKSVKFKKLVM